MKKFNVYKMAAVTGIVLLAVNMGSVQESFSASTDPDYDWKFRVPVELSGMLVTEGKVTCQVKGDEGFFGKGEQVFEIGSNGSFNSTVTVFVTIDEGENPFDADTYSCVLDLKSNDGGFFQAQSYESEYRADDLSIKAKEGAEFERKVTGDLPTP